MMFYDIKLYACYSMIFDEVYAYSGAISDDPNDEF